MVWESVSLAPLKSLHSIKWYIFYCPSLIMKSENACFHSNTHRSQKWANSCSLYSILTATWKVIISNLLLGELLTCLLPAPTTLSMDMLVASNSFANSWTACVGSSYVWGSTYVLRPGSFTITKRDAWFYRVNFITFVTGDIFISIRCIVY